MQLKVSLFIILAAGAIGCVDIPDFSDTPTIYYNGIDQYTQVDTLANGTVQRNEKVTITIDFEDGDGDLGASADDIQDSTNFRSRYLTMPGWGLEANYELVTMRMNRDSTWSESILPGDRFKWFPLLKPDGKAGPIKGKLDLYVDFRYGNSSVMTPIKFKVRIIDRNFHISNQTPETDVVIVPLPRE